MEKNSTDIDAATTQPAAMPAALQSRLLAAMQQAADEEHENREVEQMLRRLKPAAMPARLVGQLGVKMYVEAQQAAPVAPRRYTRWRSGAVAGIAAALMAAVGIPMLIPGNAVAEADRQGLVSRNVIDARGTGRVEWRLGAAPVRRYEVIYEDVFVLEDDEDTTTIIQVPSRTEVEIEEDYL